MNQLFALLILLLAGCQKPSIYYPLQDYYNKTIVPLNNANIIADGNSYVVGKGFTPFSTTIMKTFPFVSNGSVMHNIGVGGQTTQQMIADEDSQVLILYHSGVANIILWVEGGNDIYYNGSVANAIANVKTYCTKARTAGFKVIVTTCIPRNNIHTPFGDSTLLFNEKLIEFNGLLKSDNSYYDGIIDPVPESIFATYTSIGYAPDKVHPNDAGQAKYAELFVGAMLKLK